MKQRPQTKLVPELAACVTWQDVCNFLDRSRGAPDATWVCAAQYAMALAVGAD